MKKNYLKISVLAAVVLLVASCGDSKTKSGIPTVRVEQVLDGGVEMRLSELAKSIEYIPLETCDDVLLGTAIQLVNAGDNNLIIDRRGNFAALYDKDGKFLRTIGTQGKGSQELEQFKRGNYEDENDAFLIMTYRKAVRFDSEGKYINHFELEKFSNGTATFSYMGNDKYLVYHQKGNIMKNELEEFISLSNTQGDSLNTLAGEKVRYTSIQSTYDAKGEISSINVRKSPVGTYLVGDQLRIVSPEIDTIKSIGIDLKPVATYVIDYGNHKMLPDFSNEMKSLTLNHDKYLETEQNIFWTFAFPEGDFKYGYKPWRNSKRLHGRAIFNIKDKSFKAMNKYPYYDAIGIINDLDGEAGYPFWPVNIYKGAMYQILDALTFMEYAELSDSPKMKEVAAGLNENSNPVLVVVR